MQLGIITSFCLEQQSKQVTFTDVENKYWRKSSFIKENEEHNFRHVEIACGMFRGHLLVAADAEVQSWERKYGLE